MKYNKLILLVENWSLINISYCDAKCNSHIYKWALHLADLIDDLPIYLLYLYDFHPHRIDWIISTACLHRPIFVYLFQIVNPIPQYLHLYINICHMYKWILFCKLVHTLKSPAINHHFLHAMCKYFNFF